MTLFLSYARQDLPALDALLAGLRRTGQPVWLDSELAGGAAWWQTILEQIRACEVFVVAVSEWSLASKPCQAELRYAQALRRPIIPVQIGPVDSLRVTRLAATQILDFRDADDAVGDRLAHAVQQQREQAGALPSPLPEEPQVPFAYLMRVAAALDGQELTRAQQTELMAELRSRLDEDGSDPDVRHDIGRLLRTLHDRPDVTWRTRIEIDGILDTGEMDSQTPAGGLYFGPSLGMDSVATVPIRAVAPVRAQPVRVPAAAGAQIAGREPRRGVTRWLVAGGVGVLSIAAIVAAGLLLKTEAAPLQVALLDDGDLNGVMGSTIMRAAESSSTKAKHTRGVIDVTPSECAAPLYPGLDSTYRGRGMKQLTWRVSEDSGGLGRAGVAGNHFVDQNVAVFTDAERASAFVRDSVAGWHSCSGQTAIVTYFGRDSYTWLIGPQTGAAPKITQSFVTDEAADYTCQRVLSAVDAVVIDVKACGRRVVDEAGWIADRLAARLTDATGVF